MSSVQVDGNLYACQPSEIKLLPVSENGRPPYWNSIYGFDIDLCIVIDVSFCICLPNFIVIGQSLTEL